MIAKLHAKGASFMGLGQYILHDKDRATTSERVAWTETRNIATSNPRLAVRVMAATAMDADRLKREAGVRATGRKSRNAVQHLTLSWRPDEAEGLSREEMMRAALGAIRALGAEDRQALIVCHTDEAQPHVHLAINRVSPADGRMLSSSKEKLALSEWAEAYERERGEILCENRAINNAARKRGEYTRGEPDTPRHIFELQNANDNTPDAERIKAEQKALDLDLGRRTRELRTRHAEQAKALSDKLRADRRAVLDARRERYQRACDRVRAEFRDAWTERFHERRAALRDFERRETRLTGRLGNAIRAIDFGAMVRGEERRDALKRAYNMLGSAGARLEAFNRSQDALDRQLELWQKTTEREAITRERSAVRDELSTLGAMYSAERESLILRHELERAGNRTAWKTRGDQRREAWAKSRPRSQGRGPSGSQTLGQDVSEQTRALAETLRRAREGRKRDQDRGHER
ncbi:MAG: relaxase/mobilization nuclease domain-containing protein [Phycisphaerales bacterium]|nr:relaxase/mobilization nuclease domain-containing protein [Phycisphaerales bacterium]